MSKTGVTWPRRLAGIASPGSRQDPTGDHSSGRLRFRTMTSFPIPGGTKFACDPLDRSVFATGVSKVFERLTISTGAVLLLMAAPVGAATPAQISGGRLNVACQPGDPACQANPPQMQAPDEPKFRPSDRPKSRASDQPKFRKLKNSPELYVPEVEKRQSQKQLRKRPRPGDKCSPAKEKCHPKKPRHRRFHDFPFYDNDYIYPPYDYSHYLVSCSRARSVLRRNGFRSIKLIACGGRYHTFSARKGNGKFVVRVRARSGAITILRRIG